MNSNVIPFQRRPTKEHRFDSETYLYFILKGLTHMFGDDDTLKAEFIHKQCPGLSTAMLERFQGEVSKSCKEFYLKTGRR